MHALVMAMLASILIVQYLVKGRELLHPYFVLMPDVLAAIAMVVFLIRLVTSVRISLDVRYGFFLFVLLFTIVFGFAVLDVPTGAMLAGTRSYLVCLPFFLLPTVYRFTPQQVRSQLVFLLVIALLETPLAFYQRFVEFAAEMNSGDPVRGTLTTSSALSLYMLGAIAGVVIAYLRKRVTLFMLVLLAAWLFSATTINETKATLVLFPAALVVPALFMNGKVARDAMKRLVPICAVGALAVAAFVLVYNYFTQFRDYPDSIDAYFSLETLRYYLYTGAATSDQPYVGRFDSIEIAIDHIARNPLTLAFGYGAGNVSESFLAAFAGRYADYYVRFGVDQTQITQLLWEIGVVGLLAYLYLYYLVMRDAIALARSNDEAAWLGQLWVVGMLIMTFGLFYKSLLQMTDFSYLFWYLSGLVASRAAAVRRHVAERAPRQVPAAWRLALETPRVSPSPKS